MVFVASITIMSYLLDKLLMKGNECYGVGGIKYKRDEPPNGLIDVTERHHKLDEATFSDVIFFQRDRTHTDVPLTIYLEFFKHIR